MSGKDARGTVVSQRQAERRAQTKRAILEATIDLLVGEGYAATTFRSVSARAGISVGAIQYHFPSKNALLIEALDDIFQEVPHILDQVIQEDADWRVVARRTVRTLWAFYSGRRYLAGSEILLGTRMIPRGDRAVRRKRDSLEESYHRAWSRVVRNSPLGRTDGFALLAFLTAVMRGLAVIALYERDDRFFEPQLTLAEGLLAQALESGRLPGGVSAPARRAKAATRQAGRQAGRTAMKGTGTQARRPQLN